MFLIYLAATTTTSFFFACAAAAVIPLVTHPLPHAHTATTQHADLISPISVATHSGTGGGGGQAGQRDTERLRAFATRDEGSSGTSGGAIGGIIAGVILALLFLGFLIYKLRQSRLPRAARPPTSHGFPLGVPTQKHPHHHPPHHAAFASPPPAYAHPGLQQQQFYPAQPVQMPQTVHFASRESYYAPAAQIPVPGQTQVQPEQRGVRFGPVGVRRYS